MITNVGRVGIGLNSPSTKLHVYGEEGSPDGNAAAIELSNGATGSGFNNWYMRAGAIGTNTPAGGFSIGDNNAYRFVIDNAGKIGIGTTIPIATLDLSGNLGNKINIWSDGTLRYGLGVVGGLFQIYAATGVDDIAFGTGSSASFTERMRIKGNGNVGIGFNNPQFPLDINGRMRLSGTNPNDPGIWLNDAGVDRAFVGLQNNNHVGFYGGIGWGFTMNTLSGALALNGNEGSAGQVIQSNGVSTPPSWITPTNALYNNTLQLTPLGDLSSGSSTPTLIPGLSYALTAAGNCKVMVMFSIHVYAGGCDFCGSSRAFLDLDVNGTFVQEWVQTVSNGAENTFSGSFLLTFGPGSYTIELKGFKQGPSVYFTQNGSNMSLQIIPQ